MIHMNTAKERLLKIIDEIL